jgi:hypothetical protein
MSQLLVHCGGWEATKADLASVPVPSATQSYVPVPHGRFVEEVELHVPRFGLTVTSEAFALARDGQQMFGVLTCANGNAAGEYALAIGLRNSYDRSLAAELVVGTRVFCCDNLAFSGEVKASRKHTIHVFRDLPDLIYRMLGQVGALKDRTDREIAGMRGLMLASLEADHLILEAIRVHVLPASLLPKVLEAWEHPRQPELFGGRNAWLLFNAFTEVLKTRSPRQQMEDSLRLSELFRRELTLEAASN